MKYPSLVLCLATFMLSGCSSNTAPSPGLADPYPAPINNPVVSVAPTLQPWLGFQPAVITNDSGTPLHVQTPVRSLSEHQLLIDYRYLYYDDGGMQLGPLMGWHFLALEPKQTAYLDGKAMDSRAKTYRLEVRWSR